MEEKTFGPDSTNTSNQGCHWASLHKEWESVQGHGLHIHYSECNFSLQDHSHKHTHTHSGPVTVSPWTFPPQLVLLPVWKQISNPGSESTKGPQSVGDASTVSSVQRVTTCCLGGAEVGQGGTSLPWLTLKTSERWYRQASLSALSRGPAADDLGHSGKCSPARCGGMQLSCEEWWTVWPGKQSDLHILCFIQGRPRCCRWVSLGKHLPCKRLWQRVGFTLQRKL